MEKKVNKHILLKNNIKHYRRLRGMSQKTLANLVGVSLNCISDLESGKYSPSAYTAALLCYYLGIEFKELFYITVQ